MSSVILCDVDGVVADLHAVWLERYNAEYEDCLTVDDITGWSMQPFVKPACGEKIYDYLHASDLYDTVPPMQGAAEGVEALRSLGHRIVFLTSCVGPGMAHAKAHWLFVHHFLPRPHHKGMKDLVIMQDKSLARGDLMIDDYQENIRAFGGHAILFHAPYNAQEHGFIRAKGWGDVPWLVTDILGRAAA